MRVLFLTILDIFMRSLKVTADELRRAIFEMNFSVLTNHVIVELLKLVPTNDEIQMLQPFENDIANLAAPERFFWEVSKISRYGERIKAIYIRGMFDEWAEDSKRQIKVWAMASKQVPSSKKFRQVLQVLFILKSMPIQNLTLYNI